MPRLLKDEGFDGERIIPRGVDQYVNSKDSKPVGPTTNPLLSCHTASIDIYILYDVTDFTQKFHSIPVAINFT